MITPSPQHHAPHHHSGVESSVHRIFRDSLELDVDVDTDVIAGGMLDSLAFLELDDFSSVARVARLVATSAKGAA